MDVAKLYDCMTEKLTYGLEQKGYTLKEFANLSGISYKTLYNIMHQKHNTRIDTLNLMATLLDMELSDLLSPLPPSAVRRDALYMVKWQAG